MNETEAATSPGLVLELLPAMRGDAILLTWGSPERSHRIMIDAGPSKAYPAIRDCLSDIQRIQLLVLTHVDADHVEAMIMLVNDAGLGLDIGEVWHNSGAQLTDELTAIHGEILGMLLDKRGLPWNKHFTGCAVVVPDSGPLPVYEIEGMRLTVLGPSWGELRALRDVWLEACTEANLILGSAADATAALKARDALSTDDMYLDDSALDVEYLADSRSGADNSVTNASSIVLLAEYGEARVLFTGDATPRALRRGVNRLLKERELTTLPLSALKVPHHGSRKNITAELVRLMPAHQYLFSSNGSFHGHPHDEAVATVLMHAPEGVELVFNYENAHTQRWAEPGLCHAHTYSVRFPLGDTGVRVEVGNPPEDAA
jgi:beta-lactamase superfamily II metal-dependent hydrolase